MHWTELDRKHVWHPFTQEKTAPPPIAIRSAKGLMLYGDDGKEYWDLVSSWWVNIHGHAHPTIAKAIAEQAQTLEQVIFAGFTHEPAARVAAALAERLPGDLQRVFYSDNGSTAVEVALKIALQYWANQGIDKKRFAAFDGSYHGDTVGAMSVGNGANFFDVYQSMLFEVDSLTYPETWDDDPSVEAKEAQALQALDDYLDRYASELAGVIIEPLVQGASGMRMCRPEFLQQMAKRLRAAGVLLIFDEVMTGFGRTGNLFASQTVSVTPDIICLSKGITAGFLPLSVTVCTEQIYEAFLGDTFDRAFIHGHSFTANPLGCAAAIASLQVFEQENTLAKLPLIEQWHQREIQRLQPYAHVEKLRVRGTIAAMNITSSDSGYSSAVGPKLKAFFHKRGLLLRPLGNVLYILPPYCIEEEQLIQVYDSIDEAMKMIAVEI